MNPFHSFLESKAADLNMELCICVSLNVIRNYRWGNKRSSFSYFIR